jgi:16S rRNA (cytosine967-C5)-methyltransferase
MRADPVRLEALAILTAVADGQPLDRCLTAGLDRLGDTRDKAFLAELVRGTVQWQARYDHVIDQFSRKRRPDPGPLRTLLRLSLHQLLGMDGVPAYAAVHQAGQLCRRRLGVRQVAFVNGLLQAVRRKVAADPDSRPPDAAERTARLSREFETLKRDHADWLAAWHSHPRWLVERWIENYGAEQAEAICAWNNRPVPLVFHVLAPFDPAAAASLLAAAGCPVTAGPAAGALVAAERPGRALLTEILTASPHLIVQDATVQAATAWLADGLAPRAESVLDMCAAPGGKSAHLAARLADGRRLVAMDHRPERVALLRTTRDRVSGPSFDLVLADGARPPFAAATFGSVLLDGPCSGTGVLRHHPDGRWRLTREVIDRRAAFLGVLANRAADLLVPGGRLMYGTCSLEPEENEQVVAALRDQRDDLEPAPDAQGIWQRTWLPHEAVGDGFFAARLQKKE